MKALEHNFQRYVVNWSESLKKLNLSDLWSLMKCAYGQQQQQQ